jgi:hypothetical protein
MVWKEQGGDVQAYRTSRIIHEVGLVEASTSEGIMTFISQQLEASDRLRLTHVDHIRVQSQSKSIYIHFNLPLRALGTVVARTLRIVKIGFLNRICVRSRVQSPECPFSEMLVVGSLLFAFILAIRFVWSGATMT